MANEAVKVLSKMFSLAEAWNLAPPGKKPCRSVRKYRDKRCERFLTEEEFRRLGRVLAAAEADGSVCPPAIAAIRILMLTGCRRDEIVTLRWDVVDRTAGELRLKNAKTGLRMVPMTPTLERVFAGIPRVEGISWVFAGRAPGTRLSYLNRHWYRLRARAGLEDVRIHDLRHSCATGHNFYEISSDPRRYKIVQPITFTRSYKYFRESQHSA